MVEKALYLFYASREPDTPTWAKSVIYSALGYYILPADLISDLVPVVGYSDDLGALATAVAVCAVFVTPEVKAKAHQKWNDWFGNEVELDSSAEIRQRDDGQDQPMVSAAGHTS